MHFPSISADGSKIAFMSMVGGEDPGNYHILIVNSDGSGLTQLTHNSCGNTTHTVPSISADGTKIAFELYMNGDCDIFLTEFVL